MSINLNDSELKLLGAIIAAVVSAIVSTFSLYKSRKSNIDLERLKFSLQKNQKEQDAKRDYEYEALKRLYSEYEPLRFLLVEACESARREIGKLAKFSFLMRQERVEEIGSMAGGNYFKSSRMYNLLLPSVYFMLIRKILTHVDLENSGVIHLQYLLSKQAVLMFSRDGSVARRLGLKYTPYVEGWRKKRIENPMVYRRQGLPHGRVENALELFMSEDNSFQVITFGSFEEELGKLDEKSYNSPLGAPDDLFDDFSPEKRPVLWAILLCQALIYGLIIETSRQRISNPKILSDLLDELVIDYPKFGIEEELTKSVVEYVRTKVLREVSGEIAEPNKKIQPTAFGVD